MALNKAWCRLPKSSNSSRLLGVAFYLPVQPVWVHYRLSSFRKIKRPNTKQSRRSLTVASLLFQPFSSFSVPACLALQRSSRAAFFFGGQFAGFVTAGGADLGFQATQEAQALLDFGNGFIMSGHDRFQLGGGRGLPWGSSTDQPSAFSEL